MEVGGVHGQASPGALKENARILSKLGGLGKRSFKAREALKEIGHFLSKLGRLGKRSFKALREVGAAIAHPDEPLHPRPGLVDAIDS
jgi:hypothetical protein